MINLSDTTFDNNSVQECNTAKYSSPHHRVTSLTNVSATADVTKILPTAPISVGSDRWAIFIIYPLAQDQTVYQLHYLSLLLRQNLRPNRDLSRQRLKDYGPSYFLVLRTEQRDSLRFPVILFHNQLEPNKNFAGSTLNL